MFNFLKRSKIQKLKIRAADMRRKLAPMHACLTTLNADGKGDFHWVLCFRTEIQQREIELRKTINGYEALEKRK